MSKIIFATRQKMASKEMIVKNLKSIQMRAEVVVSTRGDQKNSKTMRGQEIPTMAQMTMKIITITHQNSRTSRQRRIKKGHWSLRTASCVGPGGVESGSHKKSPMRCLNQFLSVVADHQH